MTTNKVLNIYIPRMLGTITKEIITDTFHSLHIGNVSYIDMHKRVNENNNSYYFAFITLELYDTDSAKNITKILNRDGITRITYDTKNKQYWEVKQHIQRELRVKEKENMTIGFIKREKEEFRQEFREDFHKDFAELLKEVNLVCFGQQHYIDYYCN
jgi:hypothetical protein